MLNIRKIAIISSCLVTAAAFEAKADSTTVNMDSGGQTLFNQASTPLSGGTSADGNGVVLQLGYFTGTNFSGTFIPLTGPAQPGTPNTAIIPNSSPAEPYTMTSIGDITAEGGGNGSFFLPGLTFTLGDATSGNNLPTSGTQLAIRFYNNVTIASSTFYNTVTDALWTWNAPATPPSTVNISLDDLGLVWESIVVKSQSTNTAFHTSIPIPEPSTLALILVGTCAAPVAYFRRRLRSKPLTS